METKTPPGWYRCEDGFLRYWDGEQWFKVEAQEPLPRKRRTWREIWRISGLTTVGLTVVLSLLYWLTGDRLDWAMCPGIDEGCSSPMSWGVVAEAFLAVALPIGVIVLVTGAIGRWRTERSQRD